MDTVNSREEIWNRLLKAEAKARSSKISRWFKSPVLYPSLMFFNYGIYPMIRRGIYVIAYPFFGIRMRTLLPAGTDLLLNRIKSHDSEIRLAKFMCRHVQTGDVIIDIGAHYGYYSLLAASLVGDGAVYSIEASSTSFDVLKENVATHRSIHPLHRAAGEKKGKVVFYEYPGPYAEYNTTVEGAYEKQAWLKKIDQKITTVPVILLDSLITEHGIQKAFIKIDVEGGETAVLRGMTRSLAECDLTIAMEYLSNTTEFASHANAVEILKSFGYQSYAIDRNGGLQSTANIDQYLVENNLGSDNVVFVKDRCPEATVE